jgi:hypothetical protein
MTAMIEQQKITLEPGIYPGMSMADYQRVDAMNNSTLAWADCSALHLKAAIDGELLRSDTDAMQFGRALHTRILESETYADRVIIRQPCAAILSSGKSKGEPCGDTGASVNVDGFWCCRKHGGSDDDRTPGVEYITAAEATAIERAVQSIRDRRMDSLRRAKGQYELVIVAELHGVLCKARLDKFIAQPCTIVDLKKVAAARDSKSANVRPDKFEARIATMGYGAQAAMYCDLITKITHEVPRWYWLVVEDGTPFAPALIRASDDLLRAGRNEYMGRLGVFKRARDSGVWPGPADEPVTIDGPNWWLKENGAA